MARVDARPISKNAENGTISGRRNNDPITA
jgi:hypothetical protein